MLPWFLCLCCACSCGVHVVVVVRVISVVEQILGVMNFDDDV